MNFFWKKDDFILLEGNLNKIGRRKNAGGSRQSRCSSARAVCEFLWSQYIAQTLLSSVILQTGWKIMDSTSTFFTFTCQSHEIIWCYKFGKYEHFLWPNYSTIAGECKWNSRTSWEKKNRVFQWETCSFLRKVPKFLKRWKAAKLK